MLSEVQNTHVQLSKKERRNATQTNKNTREKKKAEGRKTKQKRGEGEKKAHESDLTGIRCDTANNAQQCMALGNMWGDVYSCKEHRARLLDHV